MDMTKSRVTNRKTREGEIGAKEAERLTKLRNQAKADYPPAPSPQFPDEGIGATLRKARQAQGLTWYAVAKIAGIPHAATVRDVELGKDAKISTVVAIAKALGLAIVIREAA
mgnify:FL=1